jgi:ubiquitin carboxyl-terminal hydrolase L5
MSTTSEYDNHPAVASSSLTAHATDDWCLIESDPAVFTELIESFGCCNAIELMELYSIESDASMMEHLQLLPQWQQQQQHAHLTVDPQLFQLSCYGLIFLFDYNSTIQKRHGESSGSAATVPPQQQPLEPTTPNDGNNMNTDSVAMSNDIFFAQQITTNACATQAILSVIMNAVHEGTLSTQQIGTMLSEFYQFTVDLPPYYKGMAINSSEVIRNAHNSFTAMNDTLLSMDDAKDRDTSGKGEAFHFVAYVPVNGVVYELDGLQQQPIRIGTIPDNGDDHDASSIPTTKYQWLSVARRAIQERMQLIGADTGAVKFNLMAVTSDRRTALRTLMEHCHNDDDAATGGTVTSTLLAVPMDDGSNNNNIIISSSSSSSTVLQLLLSTAVEELHIQDMKRLRYKLENQRRKHNYLGCIVQVLKELARMEKLKSLVDMAKEKQMNHKKRK